jgi:hypothetical protein
MTRRFLSSLAAGMILLAMAGSPLDAQGKGKGNDKGNEKGSKAQAAAQRQSDKGRSGEARTAVRPDDDKRGRSDDLNRGRARAAEVRELGGAVAGPAEMAKGGKLARAERKAFRSNLKSGRFLRAFDSEETPEMFRTYAVSPLLRERYAGRLASLAIARGVPENMLVITPTGSDRIVVANSNGVVLLDLDEQRARNLGAWRVVALDDDDDDDKEGSPAFCRSGAGHPNWGRQWCLDKGFGLGSDDDRRWGRAVLSQDVVLRPASTGDLTRDVLATVLGDVVFNRLAAHALTLGLVDPLVGRWVVEPAGRRVLMVNSGAVPVAEVVDSNKDDRADVLLVALRPW